MSDPENREMGAVIPVVATQLKKVRTGNVLFNVVVLVVIAIMGGLNACEARRAADRVNRATECIIEQFADHRDANEAAHRATANKLQTPYATTPPPELPHVRTRLEEACAPFIRN